MTRPGAAPDTSAASQDEENAAVTAICHPQNAERRTQIMDPVDHCPFHIFNIKVPTPPTTQYHTTYLN